MIGLSLSLTIAATILVVKGYYFVAILTFTFAVVSAYLCFDKTKENILRTSQTLQALVKEDLSVKIPKRKLSGEIHTPLQLLLEKSQEVKAQSESLKVIYESIINSMDTGILILKEYDDKIFFSNKAFFKILELPQYNNWYLARKHLKVFDAYLNEPNWDMVKEVINLKVNDKEETFSLRTFISEIHGTNYLVVNLDPIQNLIDRKEKEAWFNLMKVMSHEIINTIAPISSLASNLEYLVDNDRFKKSKEYDDIKQSIATIKKRTTHLFDFIETYRLLTELPTPKRSWFKIEALFKESKSFLAGLLNEKGILVKMDLDSNELQLYADKSQLEQVLINLITNSTYALEGIPEPEINLKAFQLNESTILEVRDNGHGIRDSIKKKIFVPFFTTRKNGSGIGLTLCRNIVNAHNGTISFNSEGKSTTFTLTFRDQAS